MINIDKLIEEEYDKCSRRISQIEDAREIIDYFNSLNLTALNTPWIDKDGVNFSMYPMYKKEILIFCDELFWSNEIETSDPRVYKEAGTIILEVYPFGKKTPGLWITFNLKEGEGCQKVKVGIEVVDKFEWICN